MEVVKSFIVGAVSHIGTVIKKRTGVVRTRQSVVGTRQGS